jgi:ABC-type transport system involved in multi-copper enzyme maturation permease subunit
MIKAWLVARRLLWQSRWLFFLLMLWPYLMAVILLVNGRPDPEDVFWVLHQECFGGLALVAVMGSTLLGNEQRSRRIIMVLSRAVSRPNYLFSLWLAAWSPLVLYVSGFIISGIGLAVVLHRSWQGILLMAAAQLVLGVWAGAISIFWSVLLPQIIASIVSMACVGGAIYLGQIGWFGPGRLLFNLFQLDITGHGMPGTIGIDVLITLLSGGVWFAAASWFFSRRDLNLTAE